MGVADDFHMDIEYLSDFVRQLDKLAGDAQALAQTLSGVTADTGRPDSDEMGRLGPTDTAQLLSRLHTRITDDGGLIAACVADSAGSDLESAHSIWSSWSR